MWWVGTSPTSLLCESTIHFQCCSLPSSECHSLAQLSPGLSREILQLSQTPVHRDIPGRPHTRSQHGEGVRHLSSFFCGGDRAREWVQSLVRASSEKFLLSASFNSQPVVASRLVLGGFVLGGLARPVGYVRAIILLQSTGQTSRTSPSVACSTTLK